MTYNDPQEVHGSECPRCLNWFRDNEEDFDADGYCWTCSEEIEAAEAEDRDDSDDEPLTLAKPVKTDWLKLAGQITDPDDYPFNAGVW
jgi:hypothetical protein